MSWLLSLKGYAYAIGAGLVVVAGFVARILFLKNARNRAEDKVDRLRASAHANKIKAKIVKEEKTKLSLKESKIKEEVKKEGEDFEGVDNLTDSNDF